MSKKIFLIFLITLLSLSCSSSDENQSSFENLKFLKSKIYINLPSDAPNYDEFFVFNGSILISASGYTNFAGSYSYDTNGNLISRNGLYDSYSYEFDKQNRVIKEINNNSGNYYSLEYGSNIITIYEYYNGETIPFSRLKINEKGKIIECQKLKETSSYTSMLEKYSYDSRGNILERRYEDNNHGGPDVIVNFEYDQNQNPYYVSLKNLYESIYYLECRNGIPNYADRGLTPNNIMKIIVDGSTTASYNYDYDEDEYPVYCSKIGQSSTTEFVFEYY